MLHEVFFGVVVRYGAVFVLDVKRGLRAGFVARMFDCHDIAALRIILAIHFIAPVAIAHWLCLGFRAKTSRLAVAAVVLPIGSIRHRLSSLILERFAGLEWARPWIQR